jgi:hypothetical protein
LAVCGSALSRAAVSREATKSSELRAQIATMMALCEKGDRLNRLSSEKT